MSRTKAEHHWVIDSIEEQSASIEIEPGMTVNIPASKLPAGATPGHVLRVTLEVDSEATRQALERSAATVRKGREMSKKIDPGGDISL